MISRKMNGAMADDMNDGGLFCSTDDEDDDIPSAFIVHPAAGCRTLMVGLTYLGFWFQQPSERDEIDLFRIFLY